MVATTSSTFLHPGPLLIPGTSDRPATSPSTLRLASPRSPTAIAAATTTAAATATAASYTYTSTPRSVTVPASTSPPSFYDVLGLPAGATGDEIKSAYRRLARSCHPDAQSSGGGAAEFMRVHAAYSTLSDPDKRAEYDRRRLLLRRSLSMPPRADMSGHGAAHAYSGAGAGGSFSGLKRRTWETDQCW